MAGCIQFSTILPLVVVLGSIIRWDTAATPVYQPESIEVRVKTQVDLQSPGFPTCCDDKYIFYKVLCVPDYPGQPCYLRMVFNDVDMTAGSSIKIYEERKLIESISQVGPVHRDTWYRPVVASNTGELILKVRLVASSGTKQHIGFSANITRSTVPGLQNWPDRPITTECPEAHPVQHGLLLMRMFSREDRIHDCAWVIRGPQNCTVYAAISDDTDTAGYDVQIWRQPFGGGSKVVYSPTNRLLVRVRKPVKAGEFKMNYGCYALHYETGSSSRECFSRTISLYGGFECPTGACVPGLSRCNGVKECLNGADETDCSNDYFTPPSSAKSWFSTGENGVTHTPKIPSHVYPSTMTPGNDTGFIFECFAGPELWLRLEYVFIALPVLLLLCVAWGCYCRIKRRKARPRGSRLGPPTEGDPPPTYNIAILDVKPEIGLLASLPSYEEVCSPSEAPPKYTQSESTPVHKGCASDTSRGKEESNLVGVAHRGKGSFA